MADRVREIMIGLDLAALESPDLSSSHNADFKATSSNWEMKYKTNFKIVPQCFMWRVFARTIKIDLNQEINPW